MKILINSGPLGAVVLGLFLIGRSELRRVSEKVDGVAGRQQEIVDKQDRADKKIAVVIARLNFRDGLRDPRGTGFDEEAG